MIAFSKLRNPGVDESVWQLTETIFSAGYKARQIRQLSAADCDPPVKDGDRRAVVTFADKSVQQYLLRRLAQQRPDAHFLLEEKVGETESCFLERVLTERTTTAVIGSGKGEVLGIDPIDGSLQHSRRLWEYAVSVGLWQDGCHAGGVILAPEVLGGLLVVGQVGKGAFLLESERLGFQNIMVSSVPETALEKADVWIGMDMLSVVHHFDSFIGCLSKQYRTVTTARSCALSLAMVTSGRVDAVIQPVQAPWDWFAGAALVRAAGGRVRFYHYRGGDGVVHFMDEPDVLSYDPNRRMTGLIAGNESLVNHLTVMLQTNWTN